MEPATLTARLINFVFPERCLGCGRLNPEPWCGSCQGDVQELHSPLCAVCGSSGGGPLCSDCTRSRRHFEWARSVYHYEGSLRQIILQYKYYDCRRLAPVLAGCLEPLLQRAMADGAEVIVPIPSEPLRRWRRGFNPPGLIALEAGKMAGLKVLSSALRRRWGGRPQVSLRGEARRVNMAGQFSIWDGAGLSGRRIILLDDVMTIGATCSEAAAILKEGGAAEVFAVTVARGG